MATVLSPPQWLQILVQGRPFLRNLIKVGTGVLVGRALMMASMPVLARLYSPAHFGALAVYTSILGPLAVIASLRLEQAIAVAREEVEAVNVLVAGGAVMAGVVAISFAGLFFVAPLAPSLIPAQEVWLFRGLIPFGVFAAGSVQLLSAWAIRVGDFRSIARTKVYQGASQALTAVAGGLIAPNPAMLILSDIAGRAAGLGTFLRLFLATAGQPLRQVSWARMKGALVRFKNFPLIAAGSALLNALGTAIPALMLSLLYSKEAVGWYAMAAQGLSVPILLAGQAAGQVYVSHAAALVRETPAALRGFFRRTALHLFFWGAGPIILLGFLGPVIFPRLLGPGWLVSGHFVRIMTPLYLLDFAFSPVSQTLLLLERQGAQFLWDSTRLTVITAGFILARRAGLGPAAALEVYTLLLSAIYLFGFILCDVHCRRSGGAADGTPPAARTGSEPMVQRPAPRLIADAVHLTSVHFSDDIRIFRKECRSLAEAGYTIALVAPQGADDQRDGIRILAVPRPEGRAARILITAWRVLAKAVRMPAKVYHLHDPELIPAGLVLRLLGRKVVFDAHEDLSSQVASKSYLPVPLRGPVRLVAWVLEEAVGRCFSAIVAATPRIAARFPPGKTWLVQNFPLPGELVTPERRPFRDRPNWATYIGGITEIRGLREIHAALRHLEDLPDLRLRMAGEPASQAFLDELASLPGGRKADYLGLLDRPEVARLLGASRCGLVLFLPLPNHTESQPNKLFEYMSAGVPIVASDFPHWRELLEPIGCAILVPPTDPERIADAIRGLVQDPERAEAMGERGRAAVAGKYNWETERTTLLGLYSRLIGAPAP